LFATSLSATSPKEDALVPSVVLVKPHDNFNANTFAATLETKWGLYITEQRPLFLNWVRVSLERQGGTLLDRPQTRQILGALQELAMIAQTSPERTYLPLRAANDAYYENMWHLQDLEMETAWDISIGDSEQRVGVVDTGLVRAHEDLIAKDHTGYDFITESNQAKDGDGRDPDYQDEGDGGECWGNEMEDSWHGTHVAGTVLASSNNELGITGVNWNAKLITGRAMGLCGGSLTDIMEAAAWMSGGAIENVPNIGEDKVSVLNMSLGGQGACSWYEQEVVDWINAQGVMVVAASGNDGGAVSSPANCNGVITVAAHDPYGTLTNYSSFDSSVEIVAPGGEIQRDLGEGVLSAVGPNTNDYQWSQGTSMAAPHVTGAISLFQAMDPDLTRFEIIELMRSTGRSCANCQGRKSLNAGAALTLLRDGELPTFEDDEFTDNQTPEGAAQLTCDTSMNLKMTPGDEDWFVLNSPQGFMVEVKVLAADVTQDLDLYVNDGNIQNGNLTQSTSPNGEESVSLVYSNGPLFFVVMPYEAARGDYTLEVSCSEFLDEYEPNNTIEQSGFLDCNTTTTHFMEQGERDWFALPVTENEAYSLDVIASGGFDLDLYVTTGATENDIVEQSATPEGSESVQANGILGQLYAVVLPFRQATGVYTINFQCPERPVPQAEEDIEEEDLNLETTQIKTQSVDGCACQGSTDHRASPMAWLFCCS
jgi:serine protease